MKIELFQTNGCNSCTAMRETLRSVAEAAVPGVVWRDVDVTAELDYAVEVGVLSLPAVVVDGELVFSSLPTAAQLTKELQRRAAGGSRGH
jgi:predicted thioredoxin/glutaredoxin